VTDLPPIADGVDHHLDERVITLDRTIGWIVTAVIATGSLVALFTAWIAAWLADDLRSMGIGLIGLSASWAIASGALAWHAHRWPAIAYRYTSYRVDQPGIEIRRGVYWRKVINVPRTRVQHTDVSQGPLERSHGLGTLVIYTAGTDHARVTLSGLDHTVALRIREHLLPREQSDAV